jgi:hypothetical protein
MGVYMIDLYRDICRPVLKLDLTAHGIVESLSEFELCLVRYRNDQLVIHNLLGLTNLR